MRTAVACLQNQFPKPSKGRSKWARASSGHFGGLSWNYYTGKAQYIQAMAADFAYDLLLLGCLAAWLLG
jgi:hypothetical protein